MKNKQDLDKCKEELIHLFNEATKIISGKEQSAISTSLDKVANQLYEYRSNLSSEDWSTLTDVGRNHCLLTKFN